MDVITVRDSIIDDIHTANVGKMHDWRAFSQGDIYSVELKVQVPGRVTLIRVSHDIYASLLMIAQVEHGLVAWRLIDGSLIQLCIVGVPVVSDHTLQGNTYSVDV